MNILVLNSGSSSIKFQLITMPSQEVIAKGLVEKIGLDDSEIHYTAHNQKHSAQVAIPDHEQGLNLVNQYVQHEQYGVIQSPEDIALVGHRVVHGGSDFKDPTIVTPAVKEAIRSLFALAPLHNPPNLKGIEVAEELYPNAVQVAVFDTAFHQTIPQKAYTYAIPQSITDEDQIRLYGFHGISHEYVSEQANKQLGRTNTKLISIHLGNGCSMTAVEQGKSIDHSLGFGPVSGLVMGTRTGDIDPTILVYLMTEKGYTAQEISDLISKQSGMLGLTGYSDLRTIEDLAQNGDKQCQLALAINTYRIRKYIGAYTAAMGGVDAIIFTAGIGENSDVIRKGALEGLEFMGISLDDDKNAVRSSELRAIESTHSKVKIFVIPTNEELEIAKQAFELVS